MSLIHASHWVPKSTGRRVGLSEIFVVIVWSGLSRTNGFDRKGTIKTPNEIFPTTTNSEWRTTMRHRRRITVISIYIITYVTLSFMICAIRRVGFGGRIVQSHDHR